MNTTGTRWTADIDGMTCNSCERHITRAVQDAGGTDVSSSWRHGTATFGGDVDEKTLAAAVSDAGYALRALHRTDTTPRAGGGGGKEFDLAIVGSGSAAFAAAIRATEAGARVVIVEKATVGVRR